MSTHGKGYDAVVEAARKAAKARLKKILDFLASSSVSDTRYGCLSGDNKTVTFQDGTTGDAVVIGNPPRCGPVRRLYGNTWCATGPQSKCISMNPGVSYGYLLKHDSSLPGFSSEKYLINKIGTTDAYTIPDTYTIVGDTEITSNFLTIKFAIGGKAILVIHYETVGVDYHDLKIYWGLITNWSLTTDLNTGNKTVTGSITNGTYTIYKSNLPDPGTPSTPDFSYSDTIGPNTLDWEVDTSVYVSSGLPALPNGTSTSIIWSPFDGTATYNATDKIYSIDVIGTYSITNSNSLTPRISVRGGPAYTYTDFDDTVPGIPRTVNGTNQYLIDIFVDPAPTATFSFTDDSSGTITGIPNYVYYETVWQGDYYNGIELINYSTYSPYQLTLVNKKQSNGIWAATAINSSVSSLFSSAELGTKTYTVHEGSTTESKLAGMVSRPYWSIITTTGNPNAAYEYTSAFMAAFKGAAVIQNPANSYNLYNPYTIYKSTTSNITSLIAFTDTTIVFSSDRNAPRTGLTKATSSTQLLNYFDGVSTADLFQYTLDSKGKLLASGGKTIRGVAYPKGNTIDWTII